MDRKIFPNLRKRLRKVTEKTKTSFDKAELELLKEGLKRSYAERFEMQLVCIKYS